MSDSTPRCAACGEATVFEEELGSAVCTACGTLVDPEQGHFEHAGMGGGGDTSGHDYARYNEPNSAVRATLKGRGGWALAGQEKEARERRNRIAMQEYIRSLTTRLVTPGAATRGQALFDQAMARGKFRWGRKAKLVAGAAVAIALREAKKGGSMKDLAYLLDEPLYALARTFKTVVELLQLKLALADPSQHLRILENHLVSLVQPTSAQSKPALTPALVSVLEPLLASSLATIHATATSLSSLSPQIPALASLPTPPTACAILMLALEAESDTSLPGALVLAGALGGRVGVGAAVVMTRYRTISGVVQEWAAEVPWLDGYTRGKGKGKAKGAGKAKTKEGRAKVAKRTVVARALKDVLQFREDIWRRQMESVERPVVDLEVDPDAQGEDDLDAEGDPDPDIYGYGDDVEWVLDVEDTEVDPAASASVPPTVTPQTAGPVEPIEKAEEEKTRAIPSHLRQRKRPKTTHQRNVERVSQFLLNPLAAPSNPGRSATRSNMPDEPSSSSEVSATPDLATHLLTTTTSALPALFSYSARPPTRLQLLADARPGGAEDIEDDELFEDGELEGLVREEWEVDVVRTAMGWHWESEDEEPVLDDGHQRIRKRKRRTSQPGDTEESDLQAEQGPHAKTRRIDMDALAKLLDPGTHLGEDGEPEDVFSFDLGLDPFMAGFDAFDDGGAGGDPDEVVEAWRPLSPGLDGHSGFDQGRYDA